MAATSESGRLEVGAQFFQAAPADEADRPGGEAQPPRHFVVRQRRLLVEQQAHQLTAALGQVGDCLAQALLALDLLEPIFTVVLGAGDVVGGGVLAPLRLAPRPPLPLQRLVSGGARPPPPPPPPPP